MRLETLRIIGLVINLSLPFLVGYIAFAMDSSFRFTLEDFIITSFFFLSIIFAIIFFKRKIDKAILLLENRIDNSEILDLETEPVKNRSKIEKQNPFFLLKNWVILFAIIQFFIGCYLLVGFVDVLKGEFEFGYSLKFLHILRILVLVLLLINSIIIFLYLRKLKNFQV